ncbi:hypothetical protein BH23GEM6_BH23GEM6_07060 [soil metagenome]
MWVLGLLLLALIIWAIVSMMGRDDTRTVAPMTDTVGAAGTMAPAAATAAMPAEAQAFMRDCQLQQGQQTAGMGDDHQWTITCFNHLANSIDAVARQHGATQNVNQHTQTIRDRMQQMEASPPESLQHANWTREAALAGANAIEGIHQQAATTRTQAQAPVTQMRSHAQEVERTELHQEQYTHVRSYFRSAGDALNAFAGTR